MILVLLLFKKDLEIGEWTMSDKRDYHDLSEIVAFALLQGMLILLPLHDGSAVPYHLNGLKLAALLAGLMSLALGIVCLYAWGEGAGSSEHQKLVVWVGQGCILVALIGATDARLFVWLPALLAALLCTGVSVFLIRRAVNLSDERFYRTRLEDSLQRYFFSGQVVAVAIDAYLVSVDLAPRYWPYNAILGWGWVVVSILVPYLVLRYNAKTAYYNRLRRPHTPGF